MSAKRVLILWDDGNLEHATRHGVTWQEIEDVLRSPRRLVFPAERAKRGTEARDISLGRTPAGRIVLIVYTFREGRIRPVSARPADGPYLERFKSWERKRG